MGYADRLGSESYNQTLSEKRVAAVKTYLVSQGIIEISLFWQNDTFGQVCLLNIYSA